MADGDYPPFNLAEFAGAVPPHILLAATVPTVPATPAKPKPTPKPADKKPTEPFIRNVPVKWWVQVSKLNKKHPQAGIRDLAMAILYLHGMKYNKGLSSACLKKFEINRRTSRRNLHLLESAGLVVIERDVNKNHPPVVTPLLEQTDVPEGSENG